MRTTGPTIDNDRLADVCRRYRVKRLALFCSVLRADFRPDSDIDTLVRFQQGQEPGFLTLAEFEQELSNLFGRAADVRTAEDLSPLFRDEVEASAEVLYDAS